MAIIDKRFLYYTTEAGFLKDKKEGKIDSKSVVFLSENGKRTIYTHGKFFNPEVFVVGTQSSSTNAFTGVFNEIDGLYDGLNIRYWLPYNGTSSAATLNLTIGDTTTGAIPVYIKGTTRFTNHIGGTNVLDLTYRENVGGIEKGWWVLGSYGDTSDGDTTYTFTSGSDGSFKVKPSNGSEQIVSIGKPGIAGTADKVEKSFVVQINSGDEEYVSKYTFDGSAAKTINISQGSNISFDVEDGELTINGDYKNATSTSSGLMSSDDKKKLDGIEEGANNYEHPSHTEYASGLYKITVDAEGHVESATKVVKSDITSLGIPAQDTDTHYESKNVVGSTTTSTADTTSVLNNGSVYLNSVENGSVTSSHKISGKGATTVKTDASGNIEINSPTTIAWGSVTGKPSTFTPSDHEHTVSDITDFPGTQELSVNGTAYDVYTSETSLPSFYAPSTLGTNGQVLKSDGTKLVWGKDNNDNTWRGVALTDGTTDTTVLGTGTNTGALKFKAGNNVSLSTSDGVITVNSSYTDTNTTYTFASGTNGSFSVTPKGGSKQTVSIGKPAEAGTADEVINPLTITVNSGTEEGTDKYTFTGADSKTLNITAGSNVTLTPSAGGLQISSSYTNTDTKAKVTTGATTKSYLVGVNSSGYTSGNATDKLITDTGVYLDTTAGKLTATTLNATTLSGNLKGTIDSTTTATTPSVGDKSTKVATTAFVDTAISSALGELADAMIFKGIVNANSDLPGSHEVGWTYRVGTKGTYAGVQCEVGDLIICITDGTSANNAHWTVAQNNIDGAVTGPTSSTDGNFALFSGTTGKIIKNSSYSPASFTYTAGTGLKKTGNEFSLDTALIEGTYGPESNVNGTNGTTVVIPQIKVDENGLISEISEFTYTSKDTDTHYTTGLYVGASGAKSNAATSNGSTYIKLYDNDASRASFKISGSGSTTVKSDASGNITINSTNTTYTLSGVLDGDTFKSTLTPSSGTATTSIVPVFSGATSSTSGKAGLVPSPESSEYNLYLKADGTWSKPTDTTYSAATTTAAGLMSAADKTKLDGIATGANKYSLPNATSSTLGGVKIGSNITVSSGTISLTKANVTAALGYTPPTTNTTYDDFVGATSSEGGESGLVPAPEAGEEGLFLKADGTWAAPANTIYTHPTYTARTGKPTANATPGFGETFTVSQITSNTLGHVTGATDRTITIPSSVATTSSSGLMSAADKSKLDGITAGANKYILPESTTEALGGIKIAKDNNAYTVTTATSNISSNITTVGKYYGVELDSTGKAFVYVPWSNTTYAAMTASEATTGTATTARSITAKVLHDKITEMLPTVTQTVTSGNEIGSVGGTKLYSPIQTTVSGNAGSATKLQTARTIDGVDFDGSSAITHYGTCSTAASTAAKTVSLTGFKLVTGSRIAIKFTVTNTAANPTLNVNSTGAKAIMYRGSAISTGYLAANRVYEFVYDGTDYELIGDINTNTTYSVATTSANGLMSSAMVTKLNGIADNADNVTFTQTLTSGTKIGSISINGTSTDIYCQTNTNTTYTAGTGLSLSSNKFSLNESTTDALGGIKIAKDNSLYTVATNTSPTISANVTTPGKYYGVEIDSTGKAFVYVPWSNTTYAAMTASEATTGTATTARSITAKVLHDKITEMLPDVMGGATSTVAGTSGLVPASAAGDQDKFLRADGTWVVPTNTTYSVATTSANGLMSSAMVTKLNGIATGATKVVESTVSGWGFTKNTGTVTSVTLTQGTGITVSNSGTAITTTGSRTITLNTATTSTIGGIKIGKDNSGYSVTAGTSSISADVTSGKYYAVEIDKDDKAFVYVPWTDNNTKNTAGSTNSSSKLFLIGATEQSANPQTYSHDTAYVGTDGHLYSNSKQVVNLSDTQALTNKTYNGYTLAAACAKAVTTSVTSGSSSLVTSGAVYTAIANAFKANDAMVFKGTLGTSDDGGTVSALPATHNVGWTYRVVTAGTYAGNVCEIGDLIICITDGTAASNAHWTVAQTNIDGAVTGPTSATNNHVVVFNGTSGRVIKSSGFTLGCSVPANAKFTDTTYTLSSFGITATSTELNYCDGVTSNIQTQLNGKASTSHNHDSVYLKLSGGTISSSSYGPLIIKRSGSNNMAAIKFENDLGALGSIGMNAVDGNLIRYNAATSASYNILDSSNSSVSLSGSTLTVKINGTSCSLTNTNTDTKIKQTSSTTDAAYPILTATATSPTSGTAYESYYNTGVTINPSTKTITATTFSGNATSATKLQTARTIDGVDFNGTAAITHYGTCPTAAATAAKTVALTGFKLVTGSRIAVKFTVTNTASSPTLNVNSTGAKAIVYRGSAISAGYLAANRVYEFVYDGTDYELIGDINTDTNTKVTSAANHYTPAVDSGSELSVDASSTTAATWGSTDLVTGVNIQRDAKGHVTGVTVDSIQMPANPNSNTIPSAYCSTAAGTAAKTASCSGYVLTANTYLHLVVTAANTAQSALTLNVNSKGAKAIYINGTASGTSNYTLPAGSYIVFYDGTAYQLRTDGVLPGKILKAKDSDTVNGLTVLTAVPANAKFTDTVYTLPLAASGTRGGIKIGYTASGANVPVQLSSEKAYVALTKTAVTTALGYTPPTTNTTYSIATNTTSGLIKPWYYHSAASTGPTTGTNSTAVAVNAISTTSGRYYAVEMDSAGRAFVNVPWTDNNTDTKVKQTSSTTDAAYPILTATATSPTSGTSYESYYNTGVTINPSTKTITATTFSGSLSGNASSATYSSNIRVTATTSANTYYPMWTTGTAAGTNYVLRGNSNFRYNIVAGTTSAQGYDSIYLGNSTASGTAGNSAGRILLYSSSTSYHYLIGGATTSVVTHTLPTTTGTILNTGTTSITAVQTSGAHIATLKINGANTKLYAPSNPSLTLGTTTTTSTAGTLVSSVAVSGHTVTMTKYNGTIGSTTKPAYFNAGVPTVCSTYAGGTAVTLNGTSKAASTASFYAPTAAGTKGQVLVSTAGAPGWKDFDEVGLVTSSDVATISQTITTSWATLVTAANMAKYCPEAGTYVIQVSGSGIGVCSGIFSWNTSGSTNDEILLHRTGASSSNIYLRLSNRILQIAGSAAITTAFTITVKVKRLI